MIFMDQRMPEMDGTEATHRIKKRHPEIIVIALSASALPDGEAKIVVGGEGFVRKPYKEEQIFDVLQKYLQLEYCYDDD